MVDSMDAMHRQPIYCNHSGSFSVLTYCPGIPGSVSFHAIATPGDTKQSKLHQGPRSMQHGICRQDCRMISLAFEWQLPMRCLQAVKAHRAGRCTTVAQKQMTLQKGMLDSTHLSSSEMSSGRKLTMLYSSNRSAICKCTVHTPHHLDTKNLRLARLIAKCFCEDDLLKLHASALA